MGAAGRFESLSEDWRDASRVYRALFALGLLVLAVSLVAGMTESLRLLGPPPIDGDASVLGRLLLSQGDYAAAVEEFRLAGLLDPERYDPAPELSMALPSPPGAAARVEGLRAATREQPTDAAAFLALGRALLLAGSSQESVRDLERARDLDPGLDGLQASLATAYLEAGRAADAERAYRAALASEPGRAQLYRGLGMALYRQGRLKEAAQAFARFQAGRAPAAGSAR